LSVTEVTRKT